MCRFTSESRKASLIIEIFKCNRVVFDTDVHVSWAQRHTCLQTFAELFFEYLHTLSIHNTEHNTRYYSSYSPLCIHKPRCKVSLQIIYRQRHLAHIETPVCVLECLLTQAVYNLHCSQVRLLIARLQSAANLSVARFLLLSTRSIVLRFSISKVFSYRRTYLLSSWFQYRETCGIINPFAFRVVEFRDNFL